MPTEKLTDMVEAIWRGYGILSRRTVTVRLTPSVDGLTRIYVGDAPPLRTCLASLAATGRNTVLASPDGEQRVAFVEHLLAAITLMQLDGLSVYVDAPELPLEDGSAQFWCDLLHSFPRRQMPSGQIPVHLPRPISVSTERGQCITAVPNQLSCLRLFYLFRDPVSKSQYWVSWSSGSDYSSLVRARTFAPKAENLLFEGLIGRVLSYDESGYDQPLQFMDEPAYHKLLDLIGDLSLSEAVNPLDLACDVISHGGSHQLNAIFTRELDLQLRVH